MTGNSEFDLISERGWRRGLRNLLRAGFGEFWRTRTWWVHVLVWSGILGLIMSAMLFGSEATSPLDAIGFMALFGGLFPTVAVVIAMQGAIVGEKQNGTAAWILSKPASRTAYIIGKFVPSAVNMPVTMLLIPMTVAAILLRVAGMDVAPLHVLGGFFVVTLNMLFFLALTVMLGAMFKRRGGVIGIPLGLLFGQQYLIGMAPFLAKVLPWGLTLPIEGDLSDSVAGAILTGNTPATWLPVAFTAVLTVVFLGVALWRFNEVEL